MASRINQSLIIENLNHYLQWHNLPFKLNREGICNGLTTLRAKYFLEGREDEFKEILEYVAGKSPSSEMETKVNHFIAEILSSHIPDKFNKSLSSAVSVQAVYINGEIKKSAFEFAVSTDNDSWANIISGINLQIDEVMKVSSNQHAISISRLENGYRVYNSNYKYGFKQFKDEHDLMKELHESVFHSKTEDIGMNISVIRKSDAIKRAAPFPTVESLIQSAKLIGNPERSSNSLELAAKFNNTDLISEILETAHSMASIDLAMLTAIQFNNAKVIEQLLQHCSNDKQTIHDFFMRALHSGRNEAFLTLISPYAQLLAS